MSISAKTQTLTAENITLAGTVTIDGPVTIDGAVTQTGGDITSDGVGVQGHHHEEQGDGQPTSDAKA